MDLNCTYTLTTPGGTITFNNGDLHDGTDKFWIQTIDGLDWPTIRAPIDQVPFGDGSIVHTFWLAGREPVLDGVLLVESVPFVTEDCVEILNEMEDDLRTAIESIVAADGTLAWTPAGQSAKSLTVRHHGQPRLDIRPIENYALRQFTFGLISESGSF